MSDSATIILASFASVAGWCLLMFLVSRVSGYAKLAARYPTRMYPAGSPIKTYKVFFNWLTYGGAILRIVSERQGLHIRVLPLFNIGHSAMLIPWADFHEKERIRRYNRDYIVLAVGSPAFATISFETDRWQDMQSGMK